MVLLLFLAADTQWVGLKKCQQRVARPMARVVPKPPIICNYLFISSLRISIVCSPEGRKTILERTGQISPSNPLPGRFAREGNHGERKGLEFVDDVSRKHERIGTVR